MKKYEELELVITRFDEVMTLDVISASSPSSSEHEKITDFSGSWYN